MGQLTPEQCLEKIMGEPVGFATTEQAEKLKRNLMLVSFVILVMVFGGINPSDSVTIFSLKLGGLTSHKIMIGTLIILTYTYVHYLSVCYEVWGEWVVRVTGARVAYVTGIAEDRPGMDYPSNPRHSTFYTWWKREAARFPIHYKQQLELAEEAKIILNELAPKDGDDQWLARSNMNRVADISGRLIQMTSTFESTKNLLMDPRITLSLKRFDLRYELLIRAQNLRVFIFELVVPIALGGASLYFGYHSLEWSTICF